MHPDITYVDFILAFIGACLLSLATIINALFKGRVTGMSGIAYSAWTCDGKIFTSKGINNQDEFQDEYSKKKKDLEHKFNWTRNLLLFFGLTFASGLGSIISYQIKSGSSLKTILYPTPLEMVEGLSLIGFAVGGFFVGLGTKMGNGCTSGHGLCGMPRLSLRSWLAVITFFGVALLTANFLNASVVKLNHTQPSYVTSEKNMVLIGGIAAGISFFFLILVGLYYVKIAKRYYELSTEGKMWFL